MKTLFPEMDAEIRDERKAAKRERVQRARRYLRGRDVCWLIDYLVDHGPQTEHAAVIAKYEAGGVLADGCGVIDDMVALWLVGKLWRQSQGVHPGSGCEYFLYGIRKVHPPSESRGGQS